MLSVCIPIYNFNVCDLVRTLSVQVEQLDVPAELILIDDCSSDIFRMQNGKCCNKHTYLMLEKNVGRSAIRNLFLKHAQNEYLLFLDCDSMIISDDFLKNYIAEFEHSNPDIICGGRVYGDKKPDRSKMLRWKYGIKKESKPAASRSEHPNASFMTNNFVITRKLFREIQFDERLKEYGHEDTLFGFELKKRGIQIKHIENAILNNDLEYNREYLDKTEKAVQNLIHVMAFTQNDPELIRDIKLLNVYEKLKKFSFLISLLFTISQSLIRFLLTHGYVSLTLFDFYKLGILNQAIKKH
ncbi:glycosyltransferase family 2 protein [Saccharicrinis sp. FJH54]|uniref:glycosyltransferase family 2 protein n=1 Tax=Saccharicrinis sp. FJH54 TaxID=3344665 RepID=UPI0035D5146F